MAFYTTTLLIDNISFNYIYVRTLCRRSLRITDGIEDVGNGNNNGLGCPVNKYGLAIRSVYIVFVECCSTSFNKCVRPPCVCATKYVSVIHSHRCVCMHDIDKRLEVRDRTQHSYTNKKNAYRYIHFRCNTPDMVMVEVNSKPLIANITIIVHSLFVLCSAHFLERFMNLICEFSVYNYQ